MFSWQFHLLLCWWSMQHSSQRYWFHSRWYSSAASQSKHDYSWSNIVDQNQRCFVSDHVRCGCHQQSLFTFNFSKSKVTNSWMWIVSSSIIAVTSLLTITMFTMKFWFVVGTQINISVRQSVLLLGCLVQCMCGSRTCSECL